MKFVLPAFWRKAKRAGDTRPDVAIVSYPKSGNTWVRFLIANLLRRDGEIVDFHSVQRYVPEVGRHDAEIARLAPPRIVKSHGTPRSGCRSSVSTT